MDDFVAILTTTNSEVICQNILSMFDGQLKRFFTIIINLVCVKKKRLKEPLLSKMEKV